MADQMNFRSAIRGFNRTDVIRHIDFLNNSHAVKLNQLHTEIEELRAELALARQLPVRSIQLEAELEASKTLCAELEEKLAAAAQGTVVPEQDNLGDYCTDLEAQLAEMQQRLADAETALAAAQNRADEAETACTAARQRVEDLETSLSIPQPDTSALDTKLADAQQRNADLDTALSASQQRIAELEAIVAAAQQRNTELEQALADAQTAAAAAPVATADLAAQELAAYRRAERVERKALSRARDIATQANGVLHDTTARVDEDAVELSQMFDQLTAQFDQLRERMIASKSTLKDAVTAMHAISTAENED